METVAFLLGPLGGVVLVPVTLLVLVGCAIVRRRWWPVLAGGGFTMVFAVSTWLYWRAFWAGWAYLDDEKLPPTRVRVVEDVALGTAAAVCVVMMASTVLAGRARTRSADSGDRA